MTVGIDFNQLSLITRALTVAFGLGLVFISLEALRRRKREVLFYVALAFLAYMVRALIGFASVVYPQLVAPSAFSIMSDVLDLFTLLLIFLAVVKE